MKIYSIKEIVEATNNLLHSKTPNKNYEKASENNLKSKEKESKDILILKKEITTNDNNYVSSLNHEIKIKPELKTKMVDELYHFLKKKLKKNTLKLIVDEQIEIRNLKNNIDYLNKNKDDLDEKYKILDNKYRSSLDLLNQTNEENKRLVNENEDLKVKNKELKENLNYIVSEKDDFIKENEQIILNLKHNLDEKELKNRSFEINNAELKNTISRYVVNSKKLQEKIKSIETTKNFEIEEINKKIKFYQDENVRLSSELLSTQRKSETIRINLTDIEKEKIKIADKINELSRSIEAKTNVVSTNFIKENSPQATKDLEKLNDKEQQSLDEVISRIFNKS